ncbi:hypothetical protein Leryth_024814 [Lithospermum erythrorhizon]|nr:hypothetical protein Leryth_024814 [Lithospermum erythrorhizon]
MQPAFSILSNIYNCGGKNCGRTNTFHLFNLLQLQGLEAVLYSVNLLVLIIQPSNPAGSTTRPSVCAEL